MYDIKKYINNYSRITILYSNCHKDIYLYYMKKIRSWGKKAKGVDCSILESINQLVIHCECIIVINEIDIGGINLDYIFHELERNNKVIYLDFGRNSEWKDKKRIFSINDTKLINRNRKISNLFYGCKNLSVITREGTSINFELQNSIAVREDAVSMIKEKILQFPYGEIFFPIKAYTANGILKQNENIVTIRNGVIVKNHQITHVPISEFGIGTNENILPTVNLTSREKSLGTCHFGFGSNKDFGGTIEMNIHFDIVITNFICYETRNNNILIDTAGINNIF
ncbi:hypothetical protein NIE88_21185 [Sporolactobacillus shoreicorticis]|uniref:Uncharacterized protein n=1 Tax=Sporolactobacillus shoreicorticis TaxID=1923877 RepID=A0ABW5S8Z5_9BACL|nr:hypothetical protein [Sporolactobacillus shoreicorticis]MCO7128247.1 hypothetical protein [Sporolactobacillus shoreicorticis]